MPRHVVLRRGIAATAADLDAALTRVCAFEERASAHSVRWRQSYVLREADGRFGLACLFDADDAAALERHAQLVRLPANEVLEVAATLAHRPFAPTRVHLVRRRTLAATPAEAEQRLAAARRAADALAPQTVFELNSHLLREPDGAIGSLCLLQALDAAALRRRDRRCELPGDDAIAVLGRIVFCRARPE